MSESAKSPLANLVRVMICLSVAGAFIAGVHYFAVDLPQQKNVQVPANDCMFTYEQCTYDYSNNHWVSLCCYKDCCTSIAEMDSALQWKD